MRTKTVENYRDGNIVTNGVNTFKADIDHLYLFNRHDCDIQPVALDDHYLCKFGAKKHGAWWIYETVWCERINISLIHNRTTIGRNEEYEIKHLEFVHQFQNLVFALSGFELDFKYTNIKLAGIDMNDAPDFTDTYIEYAECGETPLSEEELDELNNNRDFVYEYLMKHLH